jgi:hypothetical protein
MGAKVEKGAYLKALENSKGFLEVQEMFLRALAAKENKLKGFSGGGRPSYINRRRQPECSRWQPVQLDALRVDDVDQFSREIVDAIRLLR